MNLQPIFDIAEICHQHGLKDIILSPGSRCAPLTLAFSRHKNLTCKTISDERSAAFVAMGMSQHSKKASVLVCTSGSAALNYAPAVAEAYFQQIPLIIITADRPPEWIDQYDGQTIRQQNIYGKHIKGEYQFPVDLAHKDAVWHSNRIISEAINKAHSYPQGPVHINIPFREPFYPEKDQELAYNKQVKVIKQFSSQGEPSREAWKHFLNAWTKSNRKLIIAGQQGLNKPLVEILSDLSKKQKVPVIGDVVSNLHNIDEVIALADSFLSQSKKGLQESLQPDMVLSFGKSTISKNLKVFLRNNPAVEHWHIQPSGDFADTFQSLTRVINADEQLFFDKLSSIDQNESFDSQKQENFYHLWLIEERRVRRILNNHFPQEPLGEFELIYHLLNKIDNVSLHLANSMAVRYANFVGLNEATSIEVFANRGTSGIDGSTSTAVGYSLASGKETILITGDLAFFYDRNAFWHNYDLQNLKILVLNNHAGGIFRMINGPADQPELEEYFETKQPLTAKNLAEEFDIQYIKIDRRSKLENMLKQFIEESGPIIMEFESESKENARLFSEFKATISESN